MNALAHTIDNQLVLRLINQLEGVFIMAVDVFLSIKNLQKQNKQRDLIDYQTRGYLYQKNQVTYLKYEEGTEGFEGVSTTLKIEKDRVILIRHGKITMCQVFQKDLKYQGEYQTVYGTLMLTTMTNQLEITMGINHGIIKIIYDLYLEGGFNGNNTLEIKFESIK